MSATEQVAGGEESSVALRPETTPYSSHLSQNTQQQERGCVVMLPPLSEVVPGWQEAQNASDGAAVGGEYGSSEGLDGGAGGTVVPLHRRKVVRSRAAPAGPHPYLDRFASGMHRPLEGDDASWREASIQPVPIPDLGHTGIRTKFSSGAGNGFTPDGAMTDAFRSDIHDTVRNLVPPSREDARDMRARDYARATRRHRVDPCGGSLLNAHMSSLELGTIAGGGEGSLLSTEAWAGGGAGAGAGAGLRHSSSLGNFRSRFSPPSSPLSTRRALAGYGLGRNGGGRDSRATTPADRRQALLMRELSSVRLAAAGIAGGVVAGDGGSAGGGFGARSSADSRSAGVTASLKGRGRFGIRKGAGRRMRRTERVDCCRLQGPRDGDGRGGGGCGGGVLNDGLDPENGGLDFDGKLEKERVVEGRNGGGGGGSVSRGMETSRAGSSDANEAAWRENRRGRGKRRGVPTEAGVHRGGSGGGHVDATPTTVLVPPVTKPSSSSNSGQRATPTGAAAAAAAAAANARDTASPSPSPLSPSRRRRRRQPSSTKPKSRRRPKPREAVRHLKKPFSSSSLLACLLDLRFGNTQDLSPEKAPGQKWDLATLPTGIAPATAGGWDGFYESDGEGCAGDGDGVVGRACGKELPRSAAPEYRSGSSGGGGDANGADFAIVRGGCCGEAGVGDVLGNASVCREEVRSTNRGMARSR